MFRSALLSLACAALALTARADNWAPNITTGGVWDSNVTNANRGSDQLDTLALKADLLSSQRFEYGRADSLHLGFHGGAEWFPRYNGLTSGQVGLRGEWRHKLGLGALAPTLSAELAGDFVAAKETGRRGTNSGLTVSLRKRFNDLYRGTFTYELSHQDARYSVYDRTGNELTADLDRELSDKTRFTVGVRYRKGDIVSYAVPPRPDLVAIAPNRLLVDSFGLPRMAYSIDARTWAGHVALTHALDEQSAVVVGYEYRDTDHSPLRYVNHLVSVSLIYQF